MRLFSRPRPPTAFGFWLRLALLALALLLWGVMGLGCGSWPALAPPAGELPATREGRIALYERTLRAYLAAGRIPILDVGASLAEWRDTDRLVREMDAAGVALAAVTAPEEKTIWEAAGRHPGRLLPLTTEAPESVWARGEGEYLPLLRRQLDRGALAIGPLRAAGLASGEAGQRRILVLEAVLGLAAERRAPLILDMPPGDADVGRLDRLLAAQPGARVVWTEAGHLPRVEMNPGYGHALLRALSLRHANLSFALGTLPPPGPSPVIRPRRHVLYDPGGRLAQEWQAVVDSRVDHFLTGGSPGAGSAPAYARWMLGYRRAVLEALTPASRPRVAYQNAWRLLTGTDWKP
ncbi:MAG: hypothetical protein HYY66_11725 [Candidatus Tectomicrobia bacterium]|nr:hypothetical protein [Candidatus Tectomicrobia bacterium]